MWTLCQSVVMKRAHLKRKGVDLLVNLPSNFHLWSQALGGKLNDVLINPSRYEEELDFSKSGTWSRMATSPHQKEKVLEVWATWVPPVCLLMDEF